MAVLYLSSPRIVVALVFNPSIYPFMPLLSFFLSFLIFSCPYVKCIDSL
jgi:hypothetical protein